ncbi:MAG: site-2 protease family protein, partial [Candidatus Heimdallarchaeota archaeon]|nr:site-2 protease family protein [Candidatus Heimdallarchaeota archaeon]MCK5048084.1 site-2 protease family protein [Candidatus Heimdallarchaeota archaeon]
MSSFQFLVLLNIWFFLYIIIRLLDPESKHFIASPLIIIYKTEKFNRLIHSIGNRLRRFWLFFSFISVPISIILMAVSFVLLLLNFVLLVFRNNPGNALAPIIPGVTISFETFILLVIPLALALILHELGHGVIAVVEKVKVKSTGLFLAIFLFGAFIEPSEEQMNVSSKLSRLRIFAAGPIMNLLLMLILLIPLLFFTPFLSPLYTDEPGLLVTDVISESPAEKAGLEKDWIVYAFTNTTGHYSSFHDFDSFKTALRIYDVNSTVTIHTDHTNISLTVPDDYFIGIYLFNNYAAKYSFLPGNLPYIVYQEI